MRFKKIKKLKLGKIFVDRDKNEYLLKGQDFNVHWQLNLVTAVFIRDSLKIFLDKTPAFPKTANKPFGDLFDKKVKVEITTEEYDKLYDEAEEKLLTEWKNTVSDVADAFDKYISLYNALYNSCKNYSDDEGNALYSDMVEQGKLAFDKLKEIYDDLEW